MRAELLRKTAYEQAMAEAQSMAKAFTIQKKAMETARASATEANRAADEAD